MEESRKILREALKEPGLSPLPAAAVSSLALIQVIFPFGYPMKNVKTS
jgi:hypothetical protein